MLTWAMVYLAVHVQEFPPLMFLLSVVGDVSIMFFIVCAIRGWPDQEK